MAKRRYGLPKAGIYFLGKPYELKVMQSPLLRKGGFCELQDAVLTAHIPRVINPLKSREYVRAAVIDWYRQQGAEIFRARAQHYATHMGLAFKTIKITDPKTRWGTCDRHGNLSFSWRALMTPLELVDYLVVHELCHILHFNHSRAYWASVARVLPDYKLRRAALRAAEAKVMPR